jgi:hypothetical protein
MGKLRNAYNILLGNLEEKGCLDGQGVNEEIILK